MDECAECANADANPPNGCVATVNIVHATTEPYTKKATKLVTEKDDAIERTHITQPIDMCDEAGCERHCGEPE